MPQRRHPVASRTCAALALLAATTTGCTGLIGDPGTPAPLAPNNPNNPNNPATHAEVPLTTASALGPTPLRRLSREEYRTTVRDALGIEPGSSVDSAIPPDPETPFDNDAELQAESIHALVPGLDTIAADVAQRVMHGTDTATRDRVVGCTPAGAGDAACMTSFVRAVGRRMLRRPMRDDEVTTFVTAAQHAAADASDFYAGAEVVLAALLQDVEFVYRVEIGAPVPGQDNLVRVTDHELAARMSYLLWGTAPDDRLLGYAEAGRLASADGVRAVAEEMLADPRAARQIARFHAMWLGYEHEQRLPTALAAGMRQESDALIQRVVLDEQRPWFDLFTFDQTFVNDALATHYGLTPPGSTTPRWVPYGTSGRRGILSHATFLAASSPKPGDTSPTQRGLHVRRRLLCQEIPRPDPALLRSNPCTSNAQCAAGSRCVMDATTAMGVCVVDVDQPPPGDACKVQRYQQHARGVCAACHSRIDGIGFGLERYGIDGRYRDYEDGRPDCRLDGQGSIAEIGAFNGPGELGAMIASSDAAHACAVTQVFRYTMGRQETSTDGGVLAGMQTALHTDRDALRRFLSDLVSSDAFRHRVLPP